MTFMKKSTYSKVGVVNKGVVTGNKNWRLKCHIPLYNSFEHSVDNSFRL